MAATLALTAGGTSAVAAPQHAPAAAPEQPSPSESPSPSPSGSASPPSPSESSSPPPSQSSSPPPPSQSSESPAPSSSEPSPSSESPSSSKSDEPQKEDEEKKDDEKKSQQLENLTEELDEVAANANVPRELKEDVSQASADLEKLLAPKTKIQPAARDAIERTPEPLTDALKILLDPKTSPEDRDTVEKIIKQLKIVIVDFPKTPPKDWHGIGNCVEQLKHIIIVFPKLPPEIRHDFGKMMGDLSTILEMMHNPKIPPKNRHTIEKTIEPVTGGLKIMLDRKTSTENRKKIEKASDQIIDTVPVLQNPRASKKDLSKAHKEIEVSKHDINRINKSLCFEIELVWVPGTFGNYPWPFKDDGGWATSSLENQLGPPKNVGKVVLDWDYPTDHFGGGEKSVASGSKALADYVNRKSAQCPDAKFILVGYSQGANVVTDALGGTTDGAYAGGQPTTDGEKIKDEKKIHSVVLIGNPNRKAHPDETPRVPGRYKDKTLDICIEGEDLWCTPGMDLGDPRKHLGGTYQKERMDEVGKCLRKEIVDQDECDHDELNKPSGPGE